MLRYLNSRCTCPEGFRGKNCEEDIDECKIAETNGEEICNNGICINEVGWFQCFCRPGFTGDRCHLDFDECLWNYCENGATCEDKENDYKCLCVPGYKGMALRLFLAT